MQRRLAAIFSADVAGYARLMSTDEGGTLRLLTSHREVADRLIAQHGGRIANTAGDSVLAEFPSAIDAMQCALGIQERIAAVDAELPEERRVRFRIGLHVGEVMVRDGDLFGDGVNVAARLQGLSEPGAVCLSAAAHDYVERVLPVVFDDLGPQLVKNLDRPVRAYLARPSGTAPSRAVPSVHRRIEGYLARRFHELCHEALLAITAPEGLTVIGFAALASIDDASGLDLGQFAERIGVDRRRAGRIIARLRRLDLVQGSPGRGGTGERALRLTPAGIELRHRLRPALLAALDQVLAPLSEGERDILRELLARVINANAAMSGSVANADQSRPQEA